MMRCPNCQHLNAEQARYCLRCGHELPYFNRYNPPVQQQVPAPPYPQQGASAQPARPPQPKARNAQRPPAPQQPQQSQRSNRRGQPAPIVEEPIVQAPPMPEAPADFPPRTLSQLQTLEALALPYTVVEDESTFGNKHVLRISYPHGYAWQQMATLYKALREHFDKQWSVIIIQGIDTNGAVVDDYEFTNGRLTYSSKVLLGSEILNRYILETDSGLSSGSVRAVITEPGAK